MKRILLLLMILNFQFSIVNIANAQWSLLNSGTSEKLEEIFFPAPDTGYVIGRTGTILKTTDGNSWTPLSVGSNKDLTDVFFLDSQTGFVVGDSGLFAKTTDGGDNWSLQFISHTGEIRLASVCFINADTGFAGGSEDITNGIIFKTTDGGGSWSVTNSPVTNLDMYYKRIVFPSAETGYAITRGFCMKTTDGGDNWSLTDTSLANGNMFSILEDAFFFSPDTGYIVGWYNPFTGYTYNGGENWSDLLLGQWFSIDFPSRQTGYMAGLNNLSKTSDGGNTWEDITSPDFSSYLLYSMDFTNDTIGYACGENGVILKTTNGAITSVNEVSSRSDIVVYPNPANEEIKISGIKFNSGDELVISDLLGREFYHTRFPAPVLSFRMSTLDFPQGFYTLKITSEKNPVTKKIIIRK